MTGFIGAIYFHGAMLVGILPFLIIVGLATFKKFTQSLINFRINLKIFILLLAILSISGLYLTNKIYVPYLERFETSIDISNLQTKTKNATKGEASWPKWTNINSSSEIFYKPIVRAIYFTFSPFPWDVREIRHLLGMIDAIFYIYFSIIILGNIKVILKDPTLRMILLILLSYIFAFGIGVGNFGTGIRHRSKFVILFVLVAAPFLKKLRFSSKK